MTWDTFNKVATVGSVVAMAIAVMWYVVGLEGRISSMESKLQALVISPAITVGGGADAKTVPNPILQVCADLARKTADLRSENRLVDGTEVANVMERIGCFPKK